MKTLCTVIFAVLLLAFGASAQVKKEEPNAALKAATIKITLLDLPGVNIEKSKWEAAYELRIITQKELDAEVVERLAAKEIRGGGRIDIAKAFFRQNKDSLAKLN